MNDKEFLYLYGLLSAEEIGNREIPTFRGIDQSPSFVIWYKNLAAIACLVNAQKFSEENLELNLKDPHWVQEHALHHHERVALLCQHFSVLPMSFGTIFTNENNLERMLDEQYESLWKKLNELFEKQEWNLKVYSSTEQLHSQMDQHPTVFAFRKEMSEMPIGRQYLMKKKLENLILAETQKEKETLCRELCSQLKDIVTSFALRKNWGKEITRRTEEMIMNGDYLIETHRVEEFLTFIEQIELDYNQRGFLLEVTGPWPPYHFAKLNAGELNGK